MSARRASGASARKTTAAREPAASPWSGPGTDPRRLAVLLGAVVVVVHAMLALGAFNPAPHSGGDNASYITLAHSLLTTHTYTELWDPADPKGE